MRSAGVKPLRWARAVVPALACACAASALVAHARTSTPYRAFADFQGRPATASETSIELAYRAPLTGWLSVLPLVQYVRNPGMVPALDDAWIAGIRFEITRERSWPLSARRDANPAETLARAGD